MSSFAIDDLLTLHEPNGHRFDVILVEVRHAFPEAGTPEAGTVEGGPDVRVVFDTGWDTYDRAVEILRLFHSAPEVRGEGPPDGFIQGKQVRVELRLDSAQATQHFADATAEAVARRLIELRDTDLQHPLLETEAWYLTAASQALPLPAEAPQGAALREGYRTRWDEVPRVGE